jgi:hypothetical protein
MVITKKRLFDYAHKAMKGILAGTQTAPPPSENPYVALRAGKLPTIEELRTRDSNAPYDWRDQAFAGLAVKMLLNAGRAREVAMLYDDEAGILGFSSRRMPTVLAYRRCEDGPLVALALRQAGRNADAERILAFLDRHITAALRRGGGRTPPLFLAAAAHTWAARGKRAAAMAALEQAMANGWAYAIDFDDSSMTDIGDEPAFRSLRGDPRFERIRARINNHLARERREAAQLKI